MYHKISHLTCHVLYQDTQEEITKLLSSLPSAVPGRRKPTSTPNSKSADANSDSIDLDEASSTSSPASFAKHKASLTAKLSNVGAKAKSPKMATNENFTNLSQSSPDKVNY